LRPLQSQHQLDQLFLAQTLKIAAAHDNRESAKPALRKGLGNYKEAPSLHQFFFHNCNSTGRYARNSYTGGFGMENHFKSVTLTCAWAYRDGRNFLAV
jgi:hypothetical protein